MPIYEYTCDSCGHEFEKLVRAPGQRVTCLACGKRKVTKKFSLFGTTSSGKSSSAPGGGSSCSCGSCSSHSCSNCTCG